MAQERYRQAAMDLATHKALGDESRYALFCELSSAAEPCTAQELADRLGLHPNTVRLHLERLRAVGLVTVEADHRGTVGRPQHQYSVHRSSVGEQGSAYPALAAVLATLASDQGVDSDAAFEAGRAWGRTSDPDASARTESAVERLSGGMRRVGFSLAVEVAADQTRITFADCPYRDLAELHPDLVCNLHRGLCEGLIESSAGGTLEDFVALHHDEPCHMAVKTTVS